jgi:hypothetical protein
MGYQEDAGRVPPKRVATPREGVAAGGLSTPSVYFMLSALATTSSICPAM